MGGRHQYFEDLITWIQDVWKTKFDLLVFFLNHHLYVHKSKDFKLNVADMEMWKNNKQDIFILNTFLCQTCIVTTRVGVDKVIGWTTTIHPPSKTFKALLNNLWS